MNALAPAHPGTAQLLCVSAHGEGAFRQRASSLADRLSAAAAELGDVCFSVNACGEHHRLRAAVVGSSGGELAEALRRAIPRERGSKTEGPRVALMFTGQGSQYPGMARGLYAREPRFRRAFDEVAACFGRGLGAPLQALVLEGQADAARLAETDLTQSAVFAVDYAVGRLLLDWGVRPHCMLGHSVGEYAAACLSGVFDLPVAAHLVRERGRLMRELPTRGAMAAVFAAGDVVERLLEPFRGRLFVAAYNGAHVVLSGEAGALDELAPRLEAARIAQSRLKVSQAFHTPLLTPMVDAFRRAFDGAAIRAPRVKLISNVTGEAVEGPLGADYWARHVLEPVRFEQSVRSALEDGVEVFLEAGADRVLSGMCRELLGAAAVAVPTLQRKGDDVAHLLAAVGELYQRGATIDFRALHGTGARRVRDLPPYPLAAASLGRPTMPKRAACAAAEPSGITPAAWTWAPEAPRRRGSCGPGRLLVVAPDRLRPQLEIVLGRQGERWLLAVPDGADTFACTSGDGLARLVDLARAERPIAGALHLLGGWTGQAGGDAAWNEGIELGVHGLVLLAKALREECGTGTMPLVLATRGGMAVAPGEAAAEVWQSPAIAVAQALALEEPWLAGRAVDLDASASDEALVRAALEELQIEPGEERLAAIRGGVRLARTLSPAPAPIGGVEPWRPRDGEAYLLTGAASGIGGEVALHLARQARVSLVITGRRSLPPPSGQGAIGLDAGVRERVALLRELEETGARVRYEAVDAADRDAMDDVVRRARRDFGPIRGVVHCAGVVDAEALRLTAKSAEALSRVLSPKVRGTVVVDEVTREDPLRVFAAFSSVSASRSGWGKCLADYAAANFFIDQYCQLRSAQGRTGRTVAINWALWRGRGMGQALGIDAIAERSGLATLEPEVALRAFDEALGRDEAVLHVYQALPPGRARPAAPVAPPAPPPAQNLRAPGDVQRVVLEVLGEQLGLSAGAVDAGTTFRDLGVDSQGALEALRKLEARLQRKLYPTLFFEHETPEALARHLSGSNGAEGLKPEAGALPVPLATQPEARAVPSHAPAAAPSSAGPEVRDAESRDIAIVGMACRFPGADGPEAYWELLRSGCSAIREAPADRFPAETYFDPSGTAAHASYSRWGAFVEEPYAFDAMFFGISPREAVSMDPQQRLFLEVAWQAIQRAGYARERPTDVGVFVGCESNAYAEHFINSQRHAAILRALAGSAWFRALADRARADLLATLARHLAPAEITSDVVAGNGLNQVAARLSHFLDARGPSLIVNSACSSSLVAMHYACDSLRRGETSMAIAGGAFLNFGTTASVFLSKLKALSPTGECRPFDRRANGMVLGEGVGALVLKPLAVALQDRDHVHAVIKGSAVSNDGRSSGITVPTAAGQAEAIRRAYEVAGVEPATVGYVECHGTATSLGDPIEVQGLSHSIGACHGPSNPCVIGSAKGAVGHMLAAAGASSVLRVALALERRTIPPTAGYEEPSPHIDYGNFQVASGSPRAWTSAGPRRAGVNAFGFGGTNCHVILEEAPAVAGPAAGPEDPGGAHLLCLYGRTPGALQQWSRNVAGAVASRPELTPAVVCAALQRSQRPLAHVAACVVRDRAELLAALAGIAAVAERPGLHRGKVNPRCASRLTVGLGADWSPARADAEAFVAGSRRLAAHLAGALAALRCAASPEQAGLLSQYVVVRALVELGMVADDLAGEGRASAVAACLRGEIPLEDLATAGAAGAPTHRGGAANAPAAPATVVLALGMPAAALAPLGWSTARVVDASRGPVGKPWALDLFARLLAHGAALRLDDLHDERPLHVPLADYPFERTTYRAYVEGRETAPSLAGASTPALRPFPRERPQQ